MEVDDGERDEQDESADQPEELRRVLAARQRTELERQKHSQMNHAVFAPWCEVCVKAKGTGHSIGDRRTRNWQSKNSTDPEPTQISSTCLKEEFRRRCLRLKFSRSSRMAATALEQKGLTQHEVKFFAGFIQQTGVRMFINKSDGEPAMKTLKNAAAKALEGVESISQESPVGDHPRKR